MRIKIRSAKEFDGVTSSDFSEIVARQTSFYRKKKFTVTLLRYMRNLVARLVTRRIYIGGAGQYRFNDVDLPYSTYTSQHSLVVVRPTTMRFQHGACLLALALFTEASAFAIVKTSASCSPVKNAGKADAGTASRTLPPLVVRNHVVLFMGRAAAVRANTKAKTDMKKTKTNALFGKKIIMAVKDGGSPDPQANRMLFDVIKQAKANSVPVENISRAIKRASEGSAGDFKESTFEAYGFGGCSMVINVLSDNNNRATSDVKSVVNRREGKIAESGSVLFMYDRRGRVDVPAELDDEKLLEAAIEAGCDDYELAPGEEPGTSIVYTDPKESAVMLEAVNSLGHEDGVKISLVYVTKAPVECTDADFDKNMEIIDALESLDDVDCVEHNMSN